jgi:hypothetical protein
MGEQRRGDLKMKPLPWRLGGSQKQPLPVDCDQMVVLRQAPEQRSQMITVKIQDGVILPSDLHGECPWEQVHWYLPVLPTMSKVLLS